jgi:hypothetical protein
MTAPDNSFDWVDKIMGDIYRMGQENERFGWKDYDNLRTGIKNSILAKCQEREAAIDTAARIATLKEFVDWIYDPSISIVTIEDYASERIAALANKTTPTNQKAGEI